MICRFVLLCVCCAALAAPLWASPSDCETLAADASRRHGVPGGLLIAIARTESGLARGEAELRAWPWAANVQGTSHYFDSRPEMLAHLEAVMQADISNFDVGCMQLNYHWHRDKFDGLAQMLDPEANVAYAARYLRQLHDETGSWDAATRYYHSRDPERGSVYLQRVRRMWAQLDPSGSAGRGPLPVLGASAPMIADRRFQTHRPIKTGVDLHTFWEGVDLVEGNLPRLPGRP